MKKIYVGALLALSAFAFSCSKDKDKEKTPTDMLQGKWYITDAYYDHYFNGNVISGTETFEKGEITMEFKGSQVTGSSSSGTYTVPFKVIDGPKLVLNDTDTSDIKTLTDSILSIHYIDKSIPGNVLDQTENYKKY